MQQPVVATRGEDISPEYVALEAKRNAFGELKKLLVSRDNQHAIRAKQNAIRMRNDARVESNFVRGCRLIPLLGFSFDALCCMCMCVHACLQALVTPTVASIYKNSATLSNTTDEDKKQMIHGLMAQEAKRRDEFVAKLREFQEKDGLKPGQNEFGRLTHAHTRGRARMHG